MMWHHRLPPYQLFFAALLCLCLSLLSLTSSSVSAASSPSTPSPSTAQQLYEKALHAADASRVRRWSGLEVHDLHRHSSTFLHDSDVHEDESLSCALASIQRSEAIRKGQTAGISKQLGNIYHGLSWGMLASHYATSGSPDEADLCFSEARKHAGKITPYIPVFDMLGPFSIGKTELDGDPLEALGGIELLEKSRVTNRSRSFASEFADGGSVTWREVRSNAGKVDIQFPGVKWNDIVQSISMAAVESQSWLVGNILVSASGRFGIHCKGIITAYMDSIPLVGDQYHTDRVVAAVSLQRGMHTFRIRLRAKAQASFSCNFFPITSAGQTNVKNPNELKIFAPTQLPDLIDYQLFAPWIAVPVNNLSPDQLKDLKWLIPKESGFEVESDSNDLNDLGTLAAGLISYIPLRLKQIDSFKKCPSAFKLQLEARALVDGDALGRVLTSNTLTIQFRCRKSFGESFLITFRDMDGSVSYAGVVPPEHACKVPTGSLASSCPILVASHGTGVSALSMADSYKWMKKGEKNYWFGVKGGWVLTPSRHGAHNHQGIGAGTIDAAIEALAELSKSSHSPYKNRVADPQRILSTGHSMGGHGSWLWSVRNPDRLICSAPAAGWISKEYYGDSNRLFEEDMSVSHSDASLQGLLKQSVAEENPDLYAAQLAGIPTLVRVGQDDMTVHPWYSRKMVRIIKEWSMQLYSANPSASAADTATITAINSAAVLSETPKQSHWWWDTKQSNDGGVVNDPEMRRFYADCLLKRRAPRLDTAQFRVITANPATSGSKGGIQIVQLRRPGQVGSIQVVKGESEWTLSTRNVARFSVKHVPHILTPDLLPTNGFRIDNTFTVSKEDLVRIIQQQPGTGEVTICRLSTGWTICEPSPSTLSFVSGPIRQIYLRPFVYVVGTSSSDADANLDRMHAAVYQANVHAMSGEAWTRVITDTQAMQRWSAESASEMGIEMPNVILLGDSDSNSFVQHLWKLYADKAPLQFLPQGYRIQGSECEYSSQQFGFGIISLLPLPISISRRPNALALLIDGKDSIARRTLQRMSEPTIPPMVRAPFSNIMPDFVIVGKEMLWKGWGGVASAGYFNPQWNQHPNRVYDTC